MKPDRLKILFICSRNRRRSLTAERIFGSNPAWDVRSAGTEESARIKVTEGLLGWANVLVVMEKRHKERIRQKFPEVLSGKRCICLFVPDNYEFMDNALIKVLQDKMSEHFPETNQPMREEIFDVVNQSDEVVDRKPRSEVHRLGLLHRAVHILVFNSRGEVFLQKRSMKKDRHPGTWDSSASGHVDSGEHYDATAIRELREEIGLISTQPLHRLFKIDACEETDQEFVWIYRCESDGPFQLNPDEVERGDWFAPDEVKQWIEKRPEDFAPAFVYLWSRLK